MRPLPCVPQSRINPLRCTAVRFLLAGVLVGAGSLVAHAAPWSWRDTTRDVYVDGRLDRGARVVRAADAPVLAILIPGQAEAWVVDAQGNTPAVSYAARTAFRDADNKVDAVTDDKPALQPAVAGLRVNDESLLFVGGTHTILVTPHRGPDGGPITVDEIFGYVPAWRRLRDAYRPDPAALAAIKAVTEPTELTIALGTWCGDSKSNVPKILATLAAAGNDKLHLKLVAVNRKLTAPLDFIAARRLTNVPTIIAERGGSEIGRIVENPGRPTIEAELAALLGGEAVQPERVYQPAHILATGEYEIVAADGSKLGSETWELGDVQEDFGAGFLVRATRTADGVTSETLLVTDAQKRLRFLQVTRTSDAGHVRLRAEPEGSRLAAHLRGVPSGTVDQMLQMGDAYTVSVPSWAATGFSLSAVAAPGGPRITLRYAVGDDLAAPLGIVANESARSTGRDFIAASMGRVETDKLETRDAKGAVTWWLDTHLGVPIGVRLADGTRVQPKTFTRQGR